MKTHFLFAILSLVLTSTSAFATPCAGDVHNWHADFYACRGAVVAIQTGACQDYSAHQEYYPCNGVLHALKGKHCSELVGNMQAACRSTQALIDPENDRGCSDQAYYENKECWGIQNALIGLGIIQR
jgi:hypothetical protein